MEWVFRSIFMVRVGRKPIRVQNVYKIACRAFSEFANDDVMIFNREVITVITT